MKMNVYTDGNGSNLVMISGMGVYIPHADYIALLEEYTHRFQKLNELAEHRSKSIDTLIAQRDAALAQVEQLRGGIRKIGASNSSDEEYEAIDFAL